MTGATFSMTTAVYPDMFVLHLASLLGDGEGRWALDAGCGSGRNSRFLSRRAGWRVCGLDASREMLRKGRHTLTILTPTLSTGDPLTLPSPFKGEGISFVQGQLERLPFGPGAFHLAICTHVLESLDGEAVRRSAGEIWRVLKPKGWLLAVVPSSEGGGATKDELLGWFRDFETVELFHLKLEEPATSSVRGQWAFVARKKGQINEV